MEEKLIAPCGMNCALCINYLAMKYDLKKKGFKKAYCPGCLPRGKNCIFLKNQCERLGQGLLRFCYLCPDFPCRRLRDLDKRYRTRYHMSMIQNLNSIKTFGIGHFLAQQAIEWNCPECGELICCHNGLCLNCNLEKLQENKKYRWEEQ
jgi:hypothetical protein